MVATETTTTELPQLRHAAQTDGCGAVTQADTQVGEAVGPRPALGPPPGATKFDPTRWRFVTAVNNVWRDVSRGEWLYCRRDRVWVRFHRVLSCGDARLGGGCMIQVTDEAGRVSFDLRQPFQLVACGGRK